MNVIRHGTAIILAEVEHSIVQGRQEDTRVESNERFQCLIQLMPKFETVSLTFENEKVHDEYSFDLRNENRMDRNDPWKVRFDKWRKRERELTFLTRQTANLYNNFSTDLHFVSSFLHSSLDSSRENGAYQRSFLESLANTGA